MVEWKKQWEGSTLAGWLFLIGQAWWHLFSCILTWTVTCQRESILRKLQQSHVSEFRNNWKNTPRFERGPRESFLRHNCAPLRNTFFYAPEKKIYSCIVPLSEQKWKTKDTIDWLIGLLKHALVVKNLVVKLTEGSLLEHGELRIQTV